MKALKIARLNQDGIPIFDCHVFAPSGAHIDGHVRITGDFIGNESIVVDGRLEVDGLVCIADGANIKSIDAGGR